MQFELRLISSPLNIKGNPMASNPQHDKNQAAFRQMKPEIDGKYLPGHFVAIDEGKIVADGADYEALTEALKAIEKDCREILVVQAGMDYPERVEILAL